MQDLHISQLFHSHGPIRPDFEQRLDWLAQHHLKRLDEVCGIVARNPRLSGYQIIRAIRWNVPFDDWEDIPIMQRYIMLTQGIVYLKHLVADGSIKAKPTATASSSTNPCANRSKRALMGSLRCFTGRRFPPAALRL